MQKPDYIRDGLSSFLAVIATFALFMFAWQMSKETRFAAEAKANGAEKITCQEIVDGRSVTRRTIEVVDVESLPLWSASPSDDGSKLIAFLIKPAGGAMDAYRKRPIMVTTKDMKPAELQAMMARTSFEGTVRSAMSMRFDHVENFEQLYPQLDYENGLVLMVPGLAGSAEGVKMGWVMVVLTSLFLLSSLVWLIRVLVSMFRYQRFTKEQSLHLQQFDTQKPVMVRPQQVSQLANTNQYQAFDQQLYRVEAETFAIETTANPEVDFPSGRSVIWWTTLAGILMIGLAAFIGFVGVPVAFPIPTVFVVIGLGLSAFGLFAFGLRKIASDLAKPVNAIRWPVRQATIPSRIKRYFKKVDVAARLLNLEWQGDFLTNEMRHQLTRDYLADDGKAWVRISHTSTSRSIMIYSMFPSGKLLITVDQNLPDEFTHPRIRFVKAPGLNLAKMYALHQQAIASFRNELISVKPNELQSVCDYTEAIELQTIGAIPIDSLPLPLTEDLRARREAEDNHFNQTLQSEGAK